MMAKVKINNDENSTLYRVFQLCRFIVLWHYNRCFVFSSSCYSSIDFFYRSIALLLFRIYHNRNNDIRAQSFNSTYSTKYFHFNE